MLSPDQPALVLAPMDGVTDAPMRALQGEDGAYSFAVSEFLRVTDVAVPAKVFLRHVPELANGGLTDAGLKVQVQILGGRPEQMGQSAYNAWQAGAQSVDINFGCPAPTVNRNDGGASILREPLRIREIVRAVRQALPPEIPVSAKLRLGWEHPDEIHQTALMAAEGGASWLTIHARTKMQKYAPPVYWKTVGKVATDLNLPIVANGDVWTLDDFRRCRDETGCRHFMIGRGALARPGLAHQIARELGMSQGPVAQEQDWVTLLWRLSRHCQNQPEHLTKNTLHRLKQWLNMATRFGEFQNFEVIKRCRTDVDFFANLSQALGLQNPLEALGPSPG